MARLRVKGLFTGKNKWVVVAIIALLIVGLFLFFRGSSSSSSSAGPIPIVDSHVINMDKSRDRLAEIQASAKQANLPLIRWPAVDGTTIKEDDVRRHKVSKLITRHTAEKKQPGVIGCFLSHKSLLKHLESRSARLGDFLLIVF
jgi:hypothetical protein